VNLLAWLLARDRNAVIVGVVCGPLLGIGVALLASPFEVDGPTSKATTLTREPRTVEVEPSVTPSPPWGSSLDVSPEPRIAVRAAHSPTPRATVAPTPSPTPAVTPTPSPAPAAEDCVKDEDEHGGKGAKGGNSEGEPPTAEGGGQVEQTEPAEDETSPGPQEPPTNSTAEPPVKLCPAPPER